MTTLESFARHLSPQSTVKCSTCEIDVELAKLADHTCSNLANAISDSKDVYPPNIEQRAVPHKPLSAEPTDIDPVHVVPLPKRGASLYKRQKPSLPRIDPSLPSKPGRELDPRSAASIAHDLGLPSPVSAGSGRRSPRPNLPRKGSSHRIPLAPPSPELPVGQDCAFPPFPTNRPKRAQTDRDANRPKPRSVSRANTHDTTLSQSTSSSLYSSSSSGLVKSRTSDTSSYQRSRQGTLNGGPSPPSTAPSSARNSIEQRVEHDVSVTSYSTTAEDSFSRHTPPPPSRVTLSNARGSNPLNDPYFQHNDNDNSIKQHSLEPLAQAPHQKEKSQPIITFDNLLPTETETTNLPDQPNSKPSYKSKRPPPLDRASLIPPERQFPALGSRTPTTPVTAGLGRTLTRMFSRKRSQSVHAKKTAEFDVNSPRIKALAPEPPPVPVRASGEFGAERHDANPYFAPGASNAQTHPSPHDESVLPLTASEVALAASDTSTQIKDAISPLPRTEHYESEPEKVEDEQSNLPPLNRSGFDFKFDGERQADILRKTDTRMIQNDFDNALATITSTSHGQPEISLQRASIDSASSYGSVRFSHNTISTRSSPPPSDELRNQISTALRASTATIDIQSQYEPSSRDSSSEVQNDLALAQRRLSPVLENIPPYWSTQVKEPTSPQTTPGSAGSDTSTAEYGSRSPHNRRPLTPATNKGICRGCDCMIELGQKSVSSKDGRLTGRYHKECFSCHTCKEAFITADFYVFDDHPYCSHHYHVLNETLCTSCGIGIEGQYFETADFTGQETKMFHPKCLTCATCRVQLQDEYFEFQGYVYCERDAFRAANGPVRSVYDTAPSRPSPLNREYLGSGEPMTKGRFPERRTTKLMMT